MGMPDVARCEGSTVNGTTWIIGSTYPRDSILDVPSMNYVSAGNVPKQVSFWSINQMGNMTFCVITNGDTGYYNSKLLCRELIER